MITKIKNRIFPRSNKHKVQELIQRIEHIRKDHSTIVLFGSPTEGNWKGIANATVGLYPLNSLEVPQWYSNPVLNKKETKEICDYINTSNFKTVIISGFAPYFFEWIELLHTQCRIEIIYHGTISEFHEKDKQIFIQQLINYGNSGIIHSFGFVKEGLDKVFTKLYGFTCFHQPLSEPIIPGNLVLLDLDPTKIHVGVFGADTFNKNLHNQVIHALMIDQVVVHVLDKSIFNYLSLENRIVEHGTNIPREQFLGILGSMDINLYMSFNESWGLVAFESEKLKVKTLSSNHIDYYNLIRLKLEQ